MNILMIGNFGTSWDGSICDEEHVAAALEDLGHEVARWQREITNNTGWMVGTKFDFAIIAQWDGYDKDLSRVNGDTIIESIRQYTDKVIYWTFDYQAKGQEWHEKLIEGCDLYLSAQFEDNPKHRWLPQAFAPMFLDEDLPVKQRQEFGEDKEYDVIFTGTYIPQGMFRAEVLKAVDKKYNLSVFSVTQNEWRAQGLKNVYGPVLDYDLPKLIAKAKINLSVDLFPGNMGCWSDRNAQIMACGGLVLYKYARLSEEEFGGGVAYFNTVDECLEKIDYLLKNPEAAKDIAEAGYKIAHTRLMVIHRVENLLTIIENTL